MAERPIIFSAEMVRAILAGSKTQTRRVVVPSAGKQREWLTPQLISLVPHGEVINGGWQMHHPHAGKRVGGVDVEHNSPLGWVRCPYGTPGDTLWVRETWALRGDEDGHPVNANGERCYDDLAEVWYQASTSPAPYGLDRLAGNRGYFDGPWRTPIYMPRWASRITLRITDVRVQRIQQITKEEAIAEGVDSRCLHEPDESPECSVGWCDPDGFAVDNFRELWDSINGKRAPWSSNPWVWAISFERVKESDRG